ncbi:MAG: hypothetical protein C7B47_11770, partial [Sulfobacillus thermosulfidooxidans]
FGGQKSVLTMGSTLNLNIDVIGTTLLKRIVVYVNATAIWSNEPNTDRGSFTINMNTHSRHDGYCYVLVEQLDGHRAWSSPIWWKGDTSIFSRLPNLTCPLYPLRNRINWQTSNVSHNILAVSVNECADLEMDEHSDNTFLMRLTLPQEIEKKFISGTIDIFGASRYRVRESEFLTTKYGGDLWTIEDTTIKFHLPKRINRTARPVLEVLLRLGQKTATRIVIKIEGVTHVKINHYEIVDAEQNITVTVEPPKIKEDKSALTPCISHILLPWPDRLPE